MNPLFWIVTFLPLIAIAYVVWRCVRHQERIAAALAAVLLIACVAFHPITQKAADELVSRPYAETLKWRADAAGLAGKDYAFAISLLGEPTRNRIVCGAVSDASGKITRQLPVYRALDYQPSPALYMSTRFIVFLDENGVVTNYRVKWERETAAGQTPAKKTGETSR